MNENKDIVAVRDGTVIASEINYIKRRTLEQVLSASVEIGRLLCEAKDCVPQGEWMDWLAENVSYSQSTANNLMALYREYGEQAQIGFFEDNRLEIFGNLSPSQALALLPLPYAERKEFVETHDMSETSVREIQAEIKARKEAEAALQEKTEEVSGLSAKVDELEDEIEKLRAEADAAPQIDLDGEREKIREEARQENLKKIESLEKKLKKAKDDLAAANEAKDAAERGADARAQTAKAEGAKEAENKASERIDALNAKIASLEKAAQASADAAVQKFGVHFDLWQKEFAQMSSLIKEVTDDSVAEKLKAAVKQICQSMEEKI